MAHTMTFYMRHISIFSITEQLSTAKFALNRALTAARSRLLGQVVGMLASNAVTPDIVHGTYKRKYYCTLVVGIQITLLEGHLNVSS